MIRLRQVLSRYALDVLIVVAALTSALGTALRTDPVRPTGPVLWFEVVAVAVLVLTLLLRRRYPFGAPAATWVLSTSLSFLDGRLIVSQGGLWLAGLGAALLLGNLRGTMHQRLGLAIVLSGSTLIVSNDPLHTTGDFLFVPVPFLIAWLVGFALRERADQTAAAEERAVRAEREREFAARVAVAEERGRIARELHDVVAHAVSVMVLQVGAVRHRMPEGLDEDREALENVEQVGRTALTEMRRLLSAMRHDGDALELVPHPGLGDLDTLIDDVRAAGLPVRLHVEGQPVPLPPALDLSAYRILQEGLTNALRHAGARRADVSVHYGTGELEVQVCDDGRGPVGNDGLGHGLVGIGERVKIYGGQMSAGAGENGGFVLRARLPLEGLGTFNLDDYVYEALKAGASGFVLKDDPPEQLIAAVQTVAGGEALLSPSVTRQVISHFTRLQRQAPPKAVGALTQRELDVFRLITRGLSNAEIGRELFISDTTVKTHVTRLLQKLDLRDRAQAIVLAYQCGLFGE